MTVTRVARTKLNWLTDLRGADLTHAEFRVLVVLATFTDATLGNAFPGFAKLANESKVSEPTLKKALKTLQAKGWVRLTQHGGNQYGKGRANVYAVCSPATKGDNQLPPSDPGKGDNQLPPSSRDQSRDVTPELAGSEGGKSAHQGGKSTPPEGGNSVTPHQVLTTSGHKEHQVISSARESNARGRSAIASEKEREFQISRMDQEISGGFRKGERDRARQLLANGVPVSKILYKHLIPERNGPRARTHPTVAQEAHP